MTKPPGAVKALFALSLFVIPPSAWACKCAEPPPARIALANSSAVFAGYVTDIVTSGAGAERLDEHEHIVVLKVRKRWKGEPTAEERVITRKETPACGYPFQKGMVYIVFAGGPPEERRTDRCANTAPYSESLARELDALAAKDK